MNRKTKFQKTPALRFVFLAFIMLGLVFGSSALQAQTVASVNSETKELKSSVDVATAKELWESGKIDLILDVRTEEEYESELGHLPQAYLIPVRSLYNRLSELEPYKNKTIGIICHSGVRSVIATKLLEWYDFEHVINIEGGTLAWSQAGYPIEKGAWTGPPAENE